jgi:hypothetical protein
LASSELSSLRLRRCSSSNTLQNPLRDVYRAPNCRGGDGVVGNQLDKGAGTLPKATIGFKHERKELSMFAFSSCFVLSILLRSIREAAPREERTASFM